MFEKYSKKRCDPDFCDRRRGVQQELGILVVGFIEVLRPRWEMAAERKMVEVRTAFD